MILILLAVTLLGVIIGSAPLTIIAGICTLLATLLADPEGDETP